MRLVLPGERVIVTNKLQPRPASGGLLRTRYRYVASTPSYNDRPGWQVVACELVGFAIGNDTLFFRAHRCLLRGGWPKR